METQTLTSLWDREPLTVGADIPTSMLRFKLGRTHIGTPALEIARMVWDAMKRSPAEYDRRQRKETLAAALWIHADNRAEYARVMSGTF